MSDIPKCANCLFCKKVTIKSQVGKGKTAQEVEIEVNECHIYRPTRTGFPAVREDDFCSFHTNIDGNRTYSGLNPNS